METTNKIVELSKLWYKIISIDHHKDRDCHWYITQDFAYGEKPSYLVSHTGYIFDEEIDRKFASYPAAVHFLEDTLQKAISKERSWAENVVKNPKQYDDWQVVNAKEILAIMTEVK